MHQKIIVPTMLFLATGAWNTNAQGAPTVLVMLRGACSTTLNGAETGCDQKGVLTTLPNGRTIFNATGRTIATIGFAGRLQNTSDNHQVLWVDRAYINQTQILADGQCSIETVGEVMTVSCKAILKDGRLLAADLTNATRETSTPPVAAPAQSQNSNCGSMMKTHGFLSRAQFQCGFRYYSQDMIGSARACSTQFAEDETKNLLTSGMSTFDRNERERGHKVLCADILKKFPGIVRQ